MATDNDHIGVRVSRSACLTEPRSPEAIRSTCWQMSLPSQMTINRVTDELSNATVSLQRLGLS